VQALLDGPGLQVADLHPLAEVRGDRHQWFGGVGVQGNHELAVQRVGGEVVYAPAVGQHGAADLAVGVGERHVPAGRVEVDPVNRVWLLEQHLRLRPVQLPDAHAAPGVYDGDEPAIAAQGQPGVVPI